jgi:hypothetical protein
LAFVGALGGIAFGANADPTPFPAPTSSATPDAAPVCAGDLSGRVAARSSAGIVHRATIVVSHHGDGCDLAGVPDVTFGRGGAGDGTPVGYLSVPQRARVGAGAIAAFEVRYVTGDATAASCYLRFAVGGVPVQMRPFELHACMEPSEIDVSSFASGDRPPQEAFELDRSANVNVPACRTLDFALRRVDVEQDGDLRRERYALQNRGPSACRAVGAVGLRYLDRDGQTVPERLAVDPTMPLDFVIPRGREVSFSERFAIDGRPCPDASALAVWLGGAGGGVASVPVPAQDSPCRSDVQPIEVSNLVLGVPLEAR